MIRNNYVYLKMIDNVLYGVNANIKNDLSKIDVDTGFVQSVLTKGKIIDECMRPINLIEKYNNFILLVDDAGKYIAFLDYDNKNEIKYYNINMKVYNLSYPQYILDVIYEEKLYIFSAFEDSVYIFDLKSHICKKITSLFGKLDAKNNEKIFVYGYKKRDSVCLIKENGDICIYDLKTGKTAIINVDLNVQIINAVQKENNIYLLAMTGEIWRIDASNGLKELCLKGRESKLLSERKVWALAITDKFLYCLPALGNYFFIYDLKLRKLSSLENLPEDIDSQLSTEGQYKYFLSSEDMQNYYFANPTNQYILIINKNDDCINYLRPMIKNPVKDMDRLLSNMGALEEYDGALEDFLECIRRPAMKSQP